MASRTQATIALIPLDPDRTERSGDFPVRLGDAEQAVRWALEQLLASASVFDDPQLLRLAARCLVAGAELGEVLQQARAEPPGFAEATASAGGGAATVHRLVS